MQETFEEEELMVMNFSVPLHFWLECFLYVVSLLIYYREHLQIHSLQKLMYKRQYSKSQCLTAEATVTIVIFYSEYREVLQLLGRASLQTLTPSHQWIITVYMCWVLAPVNSCNTWTLLWGNIRRQLIFLKAAAEDTTMKRLYMGQFLLIPTPHFSL